MVRALTLRNTVTDSTIEFNQTDSQYVLVFADLGEVQGTHNAYKYPNQVGAFNASTALETRDINIQGYVVGSTPEEVESNKAALSMLANPTEEIELTVGNYRLFFKPDSSLKTGKNVDENNEYLCSFLIQGTAFYPLFQWKTDINTRIAFTVPMWTFPWGLKQNATVLGEKKQNLITKIINSGDIETGLLITLEARGTVVNPSITEVNSQKHIYIDKTMSAGEVIQISTEDGDKHISGTVDGVTSNYFAYWRLTSSWLKLAKGENVFQYDCESGEDAFLVTITHTPKFLGVQ